MADWHHSYAQPEWKRQGRLAVKAARESKNKSFSSGSPLSPGLRGRAGSEVPQPDASNKSPQRRALKTLKKSVTLTEGLEHQVQPFSTFCPVPINPLDPHLGHKDQERGAFKVPAIAQARIEQRRSPVGSSLGIYDEGQRVVLEKMRDGKHSVPFLEGDGGDEHLQIR